ncbi:MAG: sensor histidine kinase [Comamonadaceae bacterium]|nr:sensor histidine kinase [Comamonadaceae bacterium]
MLEVEDTGPGIAEAERARVFDRFYRVLGTDVEGSGLGLAIVREIAEQHDARGQHPLAGARRRSEAARHGAPGALPSRRHSRDRRGRVDRQAMRADLTLPARTEIIRALCREAEACLPRRISSAG